MKLQIAPLAAQGKRIEISRLDVDLTAKQPDLSVQGKLATPLTVDLDKRQADLSSIAGNLILAGTGIPDHTKAVVKGAARADWGGESANAALAVTLPDSNLDAKVAAAHAVGDVLRGLFGKPK